MKAMGKVAIGSLITLVVGSVMVGTAFAIGGINVLTLNPETVDPRIVDIDHDFNNISIDVVSDDVVFRSAGNGNCRVELYEYEDMDHEVEVQGDTLTITSDDEWIPHFTIGFSQSPKVVVYLSEDEYKNLEVEVTTGDVIFDSHFTFDEVTINISTGDLDMRDTDVNGDINIDKTTGDCDLVDVTCENLNYNSISGDIDLQNVIVSLEIDIYMTSGDVFFDGSDAFDIDVEIITGDIAGTLLTAKTFDVNVNTGDVSIPSDGNGGNCTIQIDTGDVVLDIES